MTTSQHPVVALRSVSRRFQSVVALDDVSLEAREGEVVALLGDNGAGKSTLIKILSGVHRPSAGFVEIGGQRLVLLSPQDARERGISTVFQELAVCELLSIARNIVLGNEPTRGLGPLRWLDTRETRRISERALETLGVDLGRSVDDPAATLSGGQRQAVAIARAIHFGSRCLILDEPTAALAVRQTALVLEQVKKARAAGQAVILVMHNLDEALSVADRAVVLNRGRVVGSFESPASHRDTITRLVSEG